MSSPIKLTFTHWLIIIIASLGFLFDTYQLLMTPLVGPPAIMELAKLPPGHVAVKDWMGTLLWSSALCGGVFGLLGGWLTDRLGRKFVMALGIFIYSLSPVAGAFSQTLTSFILFRCLTFIGVCIEFVAAITWLAEVFHFRAQRAKWLGITQAFASLGGVVVTGVNFWIVAHAKDLPSWGMPLAGDGHPASWRYLLLTGLIPAVLIAIMLPFVPESQVWKQSKDAGTLKRPSFGELFSPGLIRATLVTALLSACAYGVAFGVLQQTPGGVVPGLPDLKDQRDALKPLVIEAKKLSADFDATAPGSPERKAAADAVKANFGKQKKLQDEVKQVANEVQEYQETGGLVGRIALAVLLIVGLGRHLILRLLQIPGLIVLPVTYFLFYHQGAHAFVWGIALIGFVTMAQFSYLGEILPKVFPMHLRGTGGSFATNVGGRMIGTSAAFLTPKIAAMFTGSTYDQMARAAGYVGLVIVVLGIVAGLFLPNLQMLDKEEQ